MGTKTVETKVLTCDRCGDVEKIDRDTASPPHRERVGDSKGMLLILGSDTLFGADFKRVLEQNELPESTHEARLWLCVGCRGDFAKFLNEKK